MVIRESGVRLYARLIASAVMFIYVQGAVAKGKIDEASNLQRQREAPRRAYRLSDSLRRQEIGEIAVSPDGKLLAVCLGRPVGRGERYIPEAGSLGLSFSSMRNDLLVLSVRDGKVLWRTSYRSGTTAVFPRWSPRGDSLAFVSRRPSGDVRLEFWSRSQKRVVAAIPVALDFTVPMRSDSAPSSAPGPFAWVDEDQVILASSGAGDVVSSPFDESRVRIMADRWRAARYGEPSYGLVRSDDRPLCRAGDKLLQLTLSPRLSTRALATGAVKGVSVADDGSIAYVMAVGRGTLPENAPLNFFPMRNYFDFDQYALWTVSIVSPTGSAGSDVTVLESGEGPISGATLPIWSMDSRRLAGVLRFVHADGRALDAAYTWKRGQPRAEQVGTGSLAQALSTAFNYVAESQCTERNIPSSRADTVGVDAGRSHDEHVEYDERAAEVAHAQICLRDKARVPLPVGASLLGVFGPWGREEVVFAAGHSKLSGRPVGDARDGSESVATVGRAEVVGVDYRGDIISKSDERTGSFVCVNRRAGRRKCLLAVNTYLAAVIRPKRIGIVYRANGSPRRGVLLLPTGGSGSGRPPVIVIAYPGLDLLARSGGISVAINTIASQYTAPFTADGYAVFVVDFRLPSPLPSGVSVKDNVLSEVAPAVRAVRGASMVDGRRLGFWGFSYGGYTALTVLAYTTSFRAIVAMEPLGDLSQYAYADWPEAEATPCWPDVTFTTEREVEGRGGGEEKYAFIRMGAPQYRVPWKYYDNSPSLHMGRAITPTLLGAGDMDVFANGALPTYLSLTRRGVPAEFVEFYGEKHILKSPGNIRAECALTLAWFDRFVKLQQDAQRIRSICGDFVTSS